MDTGRLRRDLVTSLRLPLTGERRLFGGAVLALCAYALWVGATGAALSFGADVTGKPFSVGQGSTWTTVASGTTIVLWVLGPAGVGTFLLVRQLTNVSGNLEHHYRVQYPGVLVWPPLVGFAVAGATAVSLRAVTVPALVLLVVLGSYVLVRTLAYSYRVFSLSVPRLVQVFVFVSASVLTVTLLAGTATFAGRAAAVEETARALAALSGWSGLTGLVTGTTRVVGVAVPTLPGLAAGLPVGLSLTYLGPQVLAGLVSRGAGFTVPRSQLRTGQRHPEFARPTVNSSPANGRGAGSPDRSGTDIDSDDVDSPTARDSASNLGPVSSTDGDLSRSGGGGPSPGESGTEATSEAEDSVSHTRVFSPPDDFDADVADTPGEVGSPSGGRGDDTGPATTGPTDTAIDSDPREPRGERGTTDVETDRSDRDGGGYSCPTCGDTFSGETTFAFCPTCGSELEPE